MTVQLDNRTIDKIILYHGATDCFHIVLTLCNMMNENHVT